MMRHKKYTWKNNSKHNKIALVVEILLTISICFGMAYNSFVGISTQSDNYAVEVMSDYQTLTNNYIRNFQVLRMEAEEKINQNLSFDEMMKWLQSKDENYRIALGDGVYDGFAFTYKGGYAHSWNYGDYSEYVPESRPWYQIAEKNKGEIAVVAPYVTFLSGTNLIEDYDILRMSIVQKYNEEISFDFDLNVKEINDLIAARQIIYSGTEAFLYDKNGYILSSRDSNYYGHNINIVDKQISKQLKKCLQKCASGEYGVSIQNIDGSLRMIYSFTDKEDKTICMLIPFKEVFVRNFLFVLLLAGVLLVLEINFYFRNKSHLKFLEKNKMELDRKNKELESANNAKNEFLSRMSHELRTPLNVMNGNTVLMREYTDRNSKYYDSILECISESERASRYLLRIIDDILDIQNIEFEKVYINKVDTDLKKFIINIVNQISQECDEKGILFSYHSSIPRNILLKIDNIRVQQILINILHNAVKFTSNGGTVELTVNFLKETEKDAIVQFIITDTGIGMSEEFVKYKLFRKFAQEYTGKTSPYEGCGIGLCISKNFIQLMNGEIICKSEKGKGSTFKIIIPVEYMQKKMERKVLSHESYDLSGIRILLCEDNPMNQELEKRLLEKMNCEVEVANDGAIGLKMFSDSAINYYSIILMDIRMPNLDGLEATKQIRFLKREDAQTISILAVSANTSDEDVKDSLRSGMNEHLSKPIDVKILYQKIRSYCKIGGKP